MDTQIRKTKISEIKEILALHNENFSYMSFYFWLFMAFIPGGELIHYRGKAGLLGYMMSFRNRITEICISKNARGQGIGTKLIGESQVSTYKKTVVYTANKNNVIDFYQNLGFDVIKKGRIVKLSKNNC